MRDQPFIERRFDSGDGIITARFLQPQLAPGGEFQCQWVIEWPDRVQQRYACGIDGIQALTLAMRTVHTELKESDLYKSGKLTFENGYNLDLPPSW